jgi:DNA-directed RNA polymerase specialized sigma24 family protein
MAQRDRRMLLQPLTHVTRSGQRYHRDAGVEAQIVSALALPPPKLVARARIRDKDSPEYLKEECLVYLIRAYQQEEDLELVNALADALLRRCARWVVGRFRAFGLERDDALMAYQELVDDMIEAIIDLDSDRGDFFQVRFWRGLRSRLLNVHDRWVRSLKREQLHDSLSVPVGAVRGDEDASTESSESGVNLEERVGSGEDIALDAEQRIVIQEALLTIRDPRHREAFVLRHFEGWPLEADDPRDPCLSRHFDVSVKTIFNWLKTAEADLKVWRGSRAE